MTDAATCLDCGGEMLVHQPSPLGAGGPEGHNERILDGDRTRVAVCNACDQGWLQSPGSDSWTRIDRVGSRHP